MVLIYFCCQVLHQPYFGRPGVVPHARHTTSRLSPGFARQVANQKSAWRRGRPRGLLLEGAGWCVFNHELRAGQILDGIGHYMTYGLCENADIVKAERLLPMG